MPTIRQDENFASHMDDQIQVTTTMAKSSLEAAIYWVGNNLNPEEVFADKALQQWAEENGYKKEQE
jgi:hypothetical protein